MTTRLVWFLIFISALIAVAGLGSYKDVFNSPTRENLALSFEETKEAQQTAQVDTEVEDIAIAKELYKSAECLRCHGANGEGNQAEEAPMIAGQYDWYIVDQLDQIKSGERVNVKMQPFVKDLTKKDFDKLAKYITTLRVK